MIALILAIGISTAFALFLTPFFVKFLIKKNCGQFIRQDGPKSHFVKRGTPTMGGIVIIFATIVGYFSGAAWMYLHSGRLPKMSSALVLIVMCLMGLIGFVDDFKKVSAKQNLGLTAGKKIVLQLAVAAIFAVGCFVFPSSLGRLGASFSLSFTLDFGPILSPERIGVVLAVILLILWICFLIASWTNAVNLTDGLDGLAVGSSVFVFGGYIIISFWQFLHDCSLAHNAWEICYITRDPWDLTLVAGAITGACFGFLWHNTAPAKIFMGDTGSLALGGSFAALSVLTHTELLAAIIGGIFVLEALSVVLQVLFFKTRGKRIFKMAPIHHHFELLGWQEVNVVVRFWMLSAFATAVGIGIFYGGWIIGLQI